MIVKVFAFFGLRKVREVGKILFKVVQKGLRILAMLVVAIEHVSRHFQKRLSQKAVRKL